MAAIRFNKTGLQLPCLYPSEHGSRTAKTDVVVGVRHTIKQFMILSVPIDSALSAFYSVIQWCSGCGMCTTESLNELKPLKPLMR